MTKRIIRFLISLGVWLFDMVSGRAAMPGLVVLCYHGILDRDRDRFARQLELLKRFSTLVFADETVSAGERRIAVTFDDGLVSTVRNALPELERRKIPSVLFIPAGCFGQRCSWITIGVTQRDRDQLVYDSVMTAAQARSIAGPLVKIGSHGMTHTDFTDLDATAALGEIEDSRAVLEEALGRPVDLLSFPNGGFNDGLIVASVAAGYRFGYSIAPKRVATPDSGFIRGRITVEPTDWPLEFLMKAQGAYRWTTMLSQLRHRPAMRRINADFAEEAS
jgi:peptidoglycan/xylan/chitin deacetylase (PgdA/CDA1 family)